MFLRLLKRSNGLCQVKGMSKIQINDLVTWGEQMASWRPVRRQLRRGIEVPPKELAGGFVWVQLDFWFIEKDSCSRWVQYEI